MSRKLQWLWVTAVDPMSTQPVCVRCFSYNNFTRRWCWTQEELHLFLKDSKILRSKAETQNWDFSDSKVHVLSSNSICLLCFKNSFIHLLTNSLMNLSSHFNWLFCFISSGLTVCEERGSSLRNNPGKNSGRPTGSCGWAVGELRLEEEVGVTDRATRDVNHGVLWFVSTTLWCQMTFPPHNQSPVCVTYTEYLITNRPVYVPVKIKKNNFLLLNAWNCYKYSDIYNIFGRRVSGNSCWWLKGHMVQPHLGMWTCSNQMSTKTELFIGFILSSVCVQVALIKSFQYTLVTHVVTEGTLV